MGDLMHMDIRIVERLNRLSSLLTELTCAAPYLPENVEDITCTDNYYFRSICSYNCREGFGVRQGTSKVRVCGPTGNWIGRVPTCVGEWHYP